MKLKDLRELVRQRVWLVEIGRATRSVEETADDILALILDEAIEVARREEAMGAGAGAVVAQLEDLRSLLRGR